MRSHVELGENGQPACPCQDSNCKADVEVFRNAEDECCKGKGYGARYQDMLGGKTIAVGIFFDS